MNPEPLGLRDISLAEVARRHDLDLLGLDRPLALFARIKAAVKGAGAVLTYVTSAEYLEAFLASPHDAAVVERRFVPSGGIEGKTLLVCDDHRAEAVFFAAYVDLVRSGQMSFLEPALGHGAVIHPTAVVMDHVRLGDDVVIEPHAVVYPNTIVGSGSTIQANATVGGEGFEVKYVDGRRTLIPHSGGVALGEDTLVGSSTCVDRGLFGTFTEIGPGTKIDNLVHVGHNVVMGENCGVVAAAEIGGSSTLGDGVWLGGNMSANHEIAFGDYSFVGTGSVVVRDVPAFTLVAGVPARVMGHVCRCRARLDLEHDDVCGTCGTRYVLGESGAVALA